MSIYDDQYNEEGPDKPQPRPQPLANGLPPADVVSAGKAKPARHGDELDTDSDSPADGPRRTGCGCRSCLLAIFIWCLLCIAFCGIGGYTMYRKAPEWAHDAVVAAVEDSDLEPEAKASIREDMGRLLDEYRAGNITGERAQAALEEFAESPLPVLLIAYAAMDGYIDPSGLSDEEKSAARQVLQRVARGTFEGEIDPDDLEVAFDYISQKDFQGNRQLKNHVSDEDLRAFIAECKSVADQAGVPDEPYEVDVAGEVKRIVDRALGLPIEEQHELDKADEGQRRERSDPAPTGDHPLEAGRRPSIAGQLA